jgi:hypothetical protein
MPFSPVSFKTRSGRVVTEQQWKLTDEQRDSLQNELLDPKYNDNPEAATLFEYIERFNYITPSEAHRFHKLTGKLVSDVV